MKIKLLALALSAASMAALPAAAQARPWQSINGRQANLYHRIEQGVRSGRLTRHEAQNLRYRFGRLERRERDYRRSGHGLSRWERRDLDRRFDALSRSIRYQKHDRQHRR